MKILKSKYKLENFLFCRSIETGRILATYGTMAGLGLFTFPIKKPVTQEVEDRLGGNDWDIYRFSDIEPDQEMISELKRQIHKMETTLDIVLVEKFNSLVKLMDFLCDLACSKTTYAHKYLITNKIDSDIALNIYEDRSVKAFLEQTNDMVFVESQSCADTQELIFDVLSEPGLMSPLLETMMNYENIKK